MREIKPNSVTHLSCLMTGDRFYCNSDSKKEVWELRFHTLIKFRGAYKKLSQCKNDNGDVIRFDFNRVVIFLRRTRPVKAKVTEFDIEKFFA